MTHPLDLTVEEVAAELVEASRPYDVIPYMSVERLRTRLNALYESKRLAERGNSPGIGGLPNNHSNYDRDSKVGD